MDASRFSPTWRQALARGGDLGLLVSVFAGAATLGIAPVAQGWTGAVAAPAWLWALPVLGPPLAGGLAGVLLRPRQSTEVSARGIHTETPFGTGVEPWSGVVDLRAERRGARTVVSVYF